MILGKTMNHIIDMNGQIQFLRIGHSVLVILFDKAIDGFDTAQRFLIALLHHDK